MIDAAKITLSGNKGQLCQTFNSASVHDTAALGRAFASALDGHEAGTLRVGIKGNLGDGKSVFVKGILEGFADKNCVEMKQTEEGNCGGFQSLWRTQGGMWLRHIDAGFSTEDKCLSSYWNNNLDTQGAPFADIVEHPGRDKNNTKFDCIVRIRPVDENTRHIEVTATEALANSPGFQKFLNQTALFRAP